jgi:uridine kinase
MKKILFSFCCSFLVSGYSHALKEPKMPFFIGIVGASASGKTTIAQAILKQFQGEAIVIGQDSYYRDLSYLPPEQRAQTNFDHPDSLDFDLLEQHLIALASGKSVQVPTYDFKTHTQTDDYKTVKPQKIIIVEGILLLAMPQIRKHFDIKIFIDTAPEICLMRRINRDINERGRTLEGVQKQYLETVRPMYLRFVEPSKRYADVIIPWGCHNQPALDLVVSQLTLHQLKAFI